jgi:hypothetical protein
MLEQQHNPGRLVVDFGANAADSGSPHLELDEGALGPSVGKGVRVLYSLVVVIPLFHNPDFAGRRRPIEKAKLDRTKTEMKARFGGYTSYRSKGCGQDKLTGKEWTDCNVVFRIDAPSEQLDVDRLREWKGSLESRFAQEAIYMTLAGPVLRI